MTCHSI